MLKLTNVYFSLTFDCINKHGALYKFSQVDLQPVNLKLLNFQNYRQKGRIKKPIKTKFGIISQSTVLFSYMGNYKMALSQVRFGTTFWEFEIILKFISRCSNKDT
jgi:hypothetical protein